MSIDGKSLGGGPMYSLNLTNQIWLCKSFGDYWKVTGDMDFLREKAYPYFREEVVGRFFIYMYGIALCHTAKW